MHYDSLKIGAICEKMIYANWQESEQLTHHALQCTKVTIQVLLCINTSKFSVTKADLQHGLYEYTNPKIEMMH
jgi:hypothetical protein